jgi:hypothetical protein
LKQKQKAFESVLTAMEKEGAVFVSEKIPLSFPQLTTPAVTRGIRGLNQQESATPPGKSQLTATRASQIYLSVCRLFL